MATNLLERAGDVASSILNGAKRLLDPNSVESQISRKDLKKPDSEPAVGKMSDFIKLADQRYEESRNDLREHHAQFFEGIAFYCNQQGGQWNATSGRMTQRQSRNPDLDEKFDTRKENIIRVMADRMVSRVTAAYPDAWAAPMTDSEKDKQAAQIQRSINAHCTRRTKRKSLLRDAILLMGISTTCWIESSWDNQAYADVGIPNPDGSVDYKRAKIGDVANTLLMAIDIYPDPNSAFCPDGIHGGAYLIKRETRTLTYIKNKWGKTVSGTCHSDTYGYLLQRLQWIAGDYNHSQTEDKNASEVTTMWEKPSELYPNGRFLIYSADKTVLHAGEWPYKREDGTPYADKYPFTSFEFAKNFGSVWALNFVGDLIDVQVDLNDLASYLSGRQMWDRPVLFNPSNSQISYDDLTKNEYAQILNYKGEEMGGAKPTWMYPPPPGDFYFKQHERLMAKAEFIAGVHDFNADSASAVNSGKEFELRMQEDKSRLRPVVDRVCENVVELYEWDAQLYRQYGAAFPRLLGLDDKAVPAKDLQGEGAAAAALVDIQALRDGATRVVLQEGSGEAKLPAAQEERLDDIVKVLASPQMTPPVAEFYLDECQSIRSDAQTDRLKVGIAKVYAEQAAQAASLQQMKGQQAEQDTQAKGQQAEAMAAIDLRQSQMESQVKVDAAIKTEAARAQADQNVEQHRADAAKELETLKFRNAMALTQAQHAAPPSISLSGKLGSVGVESAEKLAGFPSTDNPAEIKAMNAPKPIAKPPAKKVKP